MCSLATRIVIVLCLLLSTGCASIISGNSDTLTVNSLEKGTRISVDGVLRGTDNATCEVKRGKPHTILVEKDGFQSVTIQTGESFDPLCLLGIFIDWGIFTIPIDLVSGGAWKTNPSMYTVTPMPMATVQPVPPVETAAVIGPMP